MAEPHHSLLRLKRERLGYSMTRLAENAGVNAALYSKIEGFAKSAPLKTAFALAEFHAVEPSELFTADGMALRIEDSEEYDPAQMLLSPPEPPPSPSDLRIAEARRKGLEKRRASYALRNAQTQKWRAEAKAASVADVDPASQSAVTAAVLTEWLERVAMVELHRIAPATAQRVGLQIAFRELDPAPASSASR